MPAPSSTLGFVLRKIDYGERDLIVTLFGPRTGKFSAMAKSARGSKRRFGGGLQPMRCLQLDYRAPSNGGLAFLNHIRVEEDYPGIEADYDCIALASYATEAVRVVVQEHQPDPSTFGLLRDFYRRLPRLDDLQPRQVLLHHFELCLLAEHGAAPQLERCFRCDEPVQTFSKLRCTRAGEGLVCDRCYRPGEAAGVLHPGTLTVLRYLRAPSGRPPDALADDALRDQARRVIAASIASLVGHDLKSKPMVDLILQPQPSPSRRST